VVGLAGQLTQGLFKEMSTVLSPKLFVVLSNEFLESIRGIDFYFSFLVSIRHMLEAIRGICQNDFWNRLFTFFI
jgi:hypothetical protein